MKDPNDKVTKDLFNEADLAFAAARLYEVKQAGKLWEFVSILDSKLKEELFDTLLDQMDDNVLGVDPIEDHT
jgi:hypothetical protein